MQRDDLSDEEILENAEEEVSDDDEEEEESTDGAAGGAGVRGKKTKKKEYVCPDSSLKPSARLRLYDNQQWRIEVELERGREGGRERANVFLSASTGRSCVCCCTPSDGGRRIQRMASPSAGANLGGARGVTQ